MSCDDERKKELERIKQWIEDRRKAMEEAKNNPDASADTKEDQEAMEKKEIKEAVTDKNAKKAMPAKGACEEDQLPKEVALQIQFEKDRINRFSSNTVDFARAKLRLDYLEKIPWVAEVFQPIDVNKARTILGAEHFGMDSVKDEVIEYIYALNKMGKISNETLVLTGPPGTGKTTIARQIAKALGREFIKIPLGGLSDEVFLRGSTTQYASSKPGAIVDALFQTGHRRLVILLDEIDKLSTRNNNSDGAAALLDALDHDSYFLDRFINIPMSMKDIIFIATANVVSNIPSALYDRLTAIEIEPYSKKEKLEICKKFLLPKVKENYGLKGRLRIEDKVLQQLVDEDTSNAGIRGVDKKVRKICKIAARITEENNQQSYTMTYKRAVEYRIISSTHKSFIKEYASGKVITSAMDVSTGKETLVTIESLFAETIKQPELLGFRKEHYEDDLTQLCSYFASRKSYYNLQDNLFLIGSFVMDVQEIERFRNDFNHRLAMFVAMYSAVKNVILPRNHAVIGDVTLLGEVKSNGMTKNHIMNAVNCGARVLFVPADIEEQMENMLSERDIHVYKVKNLMQLKEVFNYLLVFNRINEKVNKDYQNQQAPIDELMHHEALIRKIEKEKECTLREAFDYYFSDKKERDNPDTGSELSKMIGLSNVKKTVDSIVSWKSFTKKRIAGGFASKDIGLHMVFTGNPGTGKTTVAKLLGKMLYEKKLTKTDRFIEVTRDDLVGKYVGHTEDRVKNIIRQALGGILYIDEAHSLFVETENDYGRIVISTLVKEMEENRENLIVIMSGYKEEMSEMIRVNPGLKDRINFKINFEDYSAIELVDIFYALCKEEVLKVQETGREELERIFEDELRNKKKGNKDFSNGRFVRNLYEKSKMQQAMRLSEKEELSDKDFEVLMVEDVLKAYVEETKYKGFEGEERQMGFV